MHINAISFGGGVQSWAMAALAVQGGFKDAPNVAIMSDPGDEDPATWEFFDRQKGWLAARGMEVHITRREDRLPLFEYDRQQQGATCLPVRLVDVTGDKPKSVGIANRTCTQAWKIVPFRRYLRHLGAKTATACMGISLDEAHRMKPANVQWLTHRFPLVELRLSRTDCERICLEAYGEVPPNSACLGCPMLKKAHWPALAKAHPERFAQAVQDEETVSARLASRGLRAFMSSTLKPLPMVVQQADTGQLDLFGGDFDTDAECDGVCFL